MDYNNIPKEKFVLTNVGEKLSDKKLETKPIGYFKDAMIRFRKNKSSVAAAVIILILMLYALIVPILSNYDVSFRDGDLFPSGVFSGYAWIKRQKVPVIFR